MKGIAPITPKAGTQAFRSASQLPAAAKIVLLAGPSQPSGGPAIPEQINQIVGVNAENPNA